MKVEIEFEPSFKRAFKKRIQNNSYLLNKFWQKIEIFLANQYHPVLKTHKLSGKLKNLLAFTIDYNNRVIFYYKTINKVAFVDIGDHDEVY